MTVLNTIARDNRQSIFYYKEMVQYEVLKKVFDMFCLCVMFGIRVHIYILGVQLTEQLMHVQIVSLHLDLTFYFAVLKYCADLIGR